MWNKEIRVQQGNARLISVNKTLFTTPALIGFNELYEIVDGIDLKFSLDINLLTNGGSSPPSNEGDNTDKGSTLTTLRVKHPKMIVAEELNDLSLESDVGTDGIYYLNIWDLLNPMAFKYDYIRYLKELLGSSDTLDNHFVAIPWMIAKKRLLKRLNKKSPEGISLLLTRNILNNPRKLFNLITRARNILSSDVLLHLAGPVPPAMMGILVYLGVDLFDTSISLLYAMKKKKLAKNPVVNELDSIKCTCGSCMKNNLDYLGHNLLVQVEKIREIRKSLEVGGYRDYLEKDIHDSPTAAVMLRLSDHSRHFSVRTPMISHEKITCIGSESYYRPEISTYRSRIMHRFTPWPETKVVIFLPCSARKPYSFSRSVGTFLKVIRSASKQYYFIMDKLLITSPLGVVPLYLEYTFPAGHYNVPVSGHWDLEEIKILNRMTSSIVKKYPQGVKFIAHVNKDYQDLLQSIFNKLNISIEFTRVHRDVRSQQSLNELRALIKKTLRDISSKPRKVHPLLDHFKHVADYQFGAGCGEKLLGDDDKHLVRGSYPRVMQLYTRKNILLASLRPDTGTLTLSMEGAKRIFPCTDLKVVFNGKKLEGSTIFAPGIDSASKKIRPNDEVLILNKQHELIATGIAKIAGIDMLKLKKGPLVSIRKKFSKITMKNNFE